MLYENSFLDKVEFGTTSYSDFHGGGSEVKECVAGFPALKHLSIPLGLVVRSLPSKSIINTNAIMDVIDTDRYETLYGKTLETTTGRRTRRNKINKQRITKKKTI
jgi:hypothetical protein